jgi:hypothetical protein
MGSFRRDENGTTRRNNKVNTGPFNKKQCASMGMRKGHSKCPMIEKEAAWWSSFVALILTALSFFFGGGSFFAAS